MSVEEFSWGKAFGYSLRYIVYAIIWDIIGGLIMWAGVFMISSAIGHGFPFYTSNSNLEAVIGGAILMIIGLIIITLGSMAAYFKIMSRLINEATH